MTQASRARRLLLVVLALLLVGGCASAGVPDDVATDGQAVAPRQAASATEADQALLDEAAAATTMTTAVGDAEEAQAVAVVLRVAEAIWSAQQEPADGLPEDVRPVMTDLAARSHREALRELADAGERYRGTMLPAAISLGEVEGRRPPEVRVRLCQAFPDGLEIVRDGASRQVLPAGATLAYELVVLFADGRGRLTDGDQLVAAGCDAPTG